MTPPIKVTTNELTCLNCGEVFPASWSGCPRCSNEHDPIITQRGGVYVKTPTVPTINYLREGEYVRV